MGEQTASLRTAASGWPRVGVTTGVSIRLNGEVSGRPVPGVNVSSDEHAPWTDAKDTIWCVSK